MGDTLSTHYQTLGVPETACPSTIRAAYVCLMREIHPDGDFGTPAVIIRPGRHPF